MSAPLRTQAMIEEEMLKEEEEKKKTRVNPLLLRVTSTGMIPRPTAGEPPVLPPQLQLLQEEEEEIRRQEKKKEAMIPDGVSVVVLLMGVVRGEEVLAVIVVEVFPLRIDLMRLKAVKMRRGEDSSLVGKAREDVQAKKALETTPQVEENRILLILVKLLLTIAGGVQQVGKEQPQERRRRRKATKQVAGEIQSSSP